jgi:uncharacterized protein
MMPVRRDIRFALPADRICDWHQEGPAVTEFMNALSLMFPAGERFFMDSVRFYRDQITDPILQQQVAGFIGQEAMHTREHVEYNDLMTAAGLPAEKLDQWLWRFMAGVRRLFGPKNALAATIALEHYTAMLAGHVLKDPEYIAGVPGFQHVWLWHSYEETEHKSVSFDVWSAVMRPGLGNYLSRTLNMMLTTVVFWSTLTYFLTSLLRAHHRRHGGIGLRDLLRLGHFVFNPFGPRKGVIPSILHEYIDYYRPGFHPWDHDNRAYLEHLDELLDSITASNQDYAPNAMPRRVPLHPEGRAAA